MDLGLAENTFMPERDTRQRWLVAGTVVFVLSLAVGFWLGFRDRPQTGSEKAFNGSAPVRPVAKAEAIDGRAPNAPIAGNYGAHTPDGNALNRAEAQPKAADKPHSWANLKFVTHDQKPAAGVRVELSRHRLPSPEARKYTVEEKTTSADGHVDLVDTGPFGMAIKVKSDGWQIPPGALLDDGWFIAGPMPVLLERTRRIQLVAHYADGQAYEGAVLVSRESSLGFAENVEVARGAAALAVPADDPFGISVPSRRPGFADARAEYSREERAPETIRFVLEADGSNLGMIEVDLTAFARADQLLVEIIGVPFPWEVDFRARTSGGEIYASPPRKPAGYRVFVREDPNGGLLLNNGQVLPDATRSSLRVWQSEIVQVAAGETVRVVALSQQAAAVRARLVNESGQALAPGIIFVEPDLKAPTVWRNIESWYKCPKPWSAVKGWRPWMTIEDGTAELPIVDPGKRMIGCEAPGYDVTLVEVDCRPGEMHDLGTVVLKPAAGVIEIEIINFDPNLTYVVRLRAWNLSQDTQAEIILSDQTGPKHKFVGLPLRWYIVTVSNTELKVDAWPRGARLSRDRTTARLKLEMLARPLPPKIQQSDEE